MAWYELDHADDPELDELAQQFCLHPLHIEDARNPDERVKVEVGAGYTFALLKVVTLPPKGAPVFHSFSVFASDSFCITIGDRGLREIAQILIRPHQEGPQTRPARILYLIFDSLVDSYFPVLDRTDDRIDELQDRVLASPTPAVLEEIFDLKREMVDLRRVLVNTRDASMHLQRDPGSIVDAKHQLFVRDIYDHVARLLDTVETQRDLLNNTLDIYLSSIANRTNEVMKVLTVLSTIALPALVISGVFGMNVKGLPWLDYRWGAEIVAGLMVASTIGLLLWMRRTGWF